METLKREVLIYRWSLITAGLIACFWTVCYFATGQVTVTTEIKMTEDWTLKLPFGISRWWDILIGPICSIKSSETISVCIYLTKNRERISVFFLLLIFTSNPRGLDNGQIYFINQQYHCLVCKDKLY